MAGILVADSDRLTRKLALGALEQLGLPVSEAGTAKEAAAALSNEKFELLLLDTSLEPEQSDAHSEGSALCQLAQARDVSVILLCEGRDLKPALKLLDNGAADYLPRPFSVLELQARVRINLRMRAIAAERLSLVGQEREARMAVAMQSFSQGVAHNVNNLLTALLGHLSMAKMGALEPEAHIHLDSAANSAQRIVNLARQLLAFGGELKSEFRPADVAEILRWSLALFDHAALAHRVILRCHIEGTGLKSICDEFSLTTAILQVLHNGREAMPDGGELNVRLSQDGDWAKLSIKDKGQGMEPELAARLTSPFVTTKFTVGVGMGLSVVRGVLQAHGGNLEIKTAKGEGTEIIIRLPLAQKDTRVLRATASLRPGCRLVLASDGAESTGVFGSLLHRAGAHVMAVEDLDALLSIFMSDATPPEAVIIDLNLMPQSRREAVAELRRVASRVPIICIGSAANDLPPDDERTISLVKPFQPGILADTLARMPGLAAERIAAK